MSILFKWKHLENNNRGPFPFLSVLLVCSDLGAPWSIHFSQATVETSGNSWFKLCPEGI